MVGYGEMEKIDPERFDRNKSCYVWFTDAYKEIERINNAPDQEKQRLTDYLMTWMNHKRSELMPRKKAK